MGLDPHRDRLCVVQLSPGDGSADVVQMPLGAANAPNLKKLLGDPSIVKIFHFARFDVAVLFNALGVMPSPVYCTKIASRLVRTYTDRHGLKDLVKELLGIDLSKQQQSSDWGAADLTEAQVAYAASDVLHLHASRNKLDGHAGAGKPRGTRGGLFRLFAVSGEARFVGLGSGRHFCPFLSRASSPSAGHIRWRRSVRNCFILCGVTSVRHVKRRG